MPGLENLQIMPTSGEPPTPAVQAQQHRLEHALEDELVDGAGDAGEAARHAGALDRVGVGRAPSSASGSNRVQSVITCPHPLPSNGVLRR